MSYKWKLEFIKSYSMVIDSILRTALRGERPLGCIYAKVVEWAKQLVIDGAWFLYTGDDVEGRAAMNRIDSLTHAGVQRLAELCGKLATLIAASKLRDERQGHVSGRALIAAHNVERKALIPVWRIAAPRLLPSNVIPLRRAA